MINSEFINNGLGNIGSSKPTCHKQSHCSTKKLVLRDVQNDNRSLIRNGQESLPFLEGKPIFDAIKACETKRVIPEYPSSQICPPPLINSGAKSKNEQGKGKNEDNVDAYSECPQSRYFCTSEIPQKQAQTKESNTRCLPVVTANHTSPMMTFSYGSPSVPNSLGRLNNGQRAVEYDCIKGPDELQRREQFVYLQNCIKNCNEFNERDYAQMLIHLSPAELSRHAVELEKRAIQLTIEEGKEMRRMKTLNILGKSLAPNNPSEMSQQLQFKK